MVIDKKIAEIVPHERQIKFQQTYDDLLFLQE